MRVRRWRISFLLPSVVSSPLLILSEEAHKQNRHHTWRKLWLNLAIAEKELGLPIPSEAIEQMENNLVSSHSLLFNESQISDTVRDSA